MQDSSKFCEIKIGYWKVKSIGQKRKAAVIGALLMACFIWRSYRHKGYLFQSLNIVPDNLYGTENIFSFAFVDRKLCNAFCY
jgi:hypothetical protein